MDRSDQDLLIDIINNLRSSENRAAQLGDKELIRTLGLLHKDLDEARERLGHQMPSEDGLVPLSGGQPKR